MLHPLALCEEHFGKPVLREAKPIKLARVPVNGERLQDSVILHPRYVPRGVEHELFSARVYRRGRTVDLFLDEPIEIAGEEYGILNFKGVGANARAHQSQMVINSDKWYGDCSSSRVKWIPRALGDRHGRVWGALVRERGEDEFAAEIFHTHGIRHAPHVALNPIPREVTEKIRQVHHGSEEHDLTQLVRACRTNVRVDEFAVENNRRHYQECTPQWIEDIAEIDATILTAQIELARTDKTLAFIGRLAENRFIDGVLTDEENYSCRDFDDAKSTPRYFIYSLIESSEAIIPLDFRSVYRAHILRKINPLMNHDSKSTKSNELVGWIHDLFYQDAPCCDYTALR